MECSCLKIWQCKWRQYKWAPDLEDGCGGCGVRAEAAVVRAAPEDLRAALESARGPATCPPSWCRVAAFLYYLKS